MVSENQLLISVGNARKERLRAYSKSAGLSMGEVCRRAIDDLISFEPEVGGFTSTTKEGSE